MHGNSDGSDAGILDMTCRANLALFHLLWVAPEVEKCRGAGTTAPPSPSHSALSAATGVQQHTQPDGDGALTMKAYVHTYKLQKYLPFRDALLVLRSPEKPSHL